MPTFAVTWYAYLGEEGTELIEADSEAEAEAFVIENIGCWWSLATEIENTAEAKEVEGEDEDEDED